MSPAPRTQHQRIVGNLYMLLRNFVETNAHGEVFLSPIDVILSSMTIVQPDIVFVRADHAEIIRDLNTQGPPDLCIEVLSPATALVDRERKRDLYARYGVGEYWIVDPDRRCITIYRRAASTYTASDECLWRVFGDVNAGGLYAKVHEYEPPVEPHRPGMDVPPTPSPVRLLHRRWPRHSLRTVFDAIFYVLRAGCPWRYPPADFPPWQTVYYHFRRFRLCGICQIILVALRRAERADRSLPAALGGDHGCPECEDRGGVCTQ